MSINDELQVIKDQYLNGVIDREEYKNQVYSLSAMLYAQIRQLQDEVDAAQKFYRKENLDAIDGKKCHCCTFRVNHPGLFEDNSGLCKVTCKKTGLVVSLSDKACLNYEWYILSNVNSPLTDKSVKNR